jgi:hypothetical protein
VLPLPEVIGSAWNTLIFFGLRCQQHVIIRRLHDLCLPAKVICSRRAILITRVPYVHQIQPFPSNYAGDKVLKLSRPQNSMKCSGQTAAAGCPEHFIACGWWFPIESYLLSQSIRPKFRHLKVLEYIHNRLLFPWPGLCGIFPILFVWQRRCYSYWWASTEYRE